MALAVFQHGNRRDDIMGTMPFVVRVSWGDGRPMLDVPIMAQERVGLQEPDVPHVIRAAREAASAILPYRVECLQFEMLFHASHNDRLPEPLHQ